MANYATITVESEVKNGLSHTFSIILQRVLAKEKSRVDLLALSTRLING